MKLPMYFEIWLSAMNGYAVVLVVVCRCYLIIGAAAGRRFRGVTIAEHQKRVPTQPPYRRHPKLAGKRYGWGDGTKSGVAQPSSANNARIFYDRQGQSGNAPTPTPMHANQLRYNIVWEGTPSFDFACSPKLM